MLTSKYFTGKYLTCNEYRTMFCLSRLGYLKDFKLALRLNETISMELQFIGLMHFNIENKELEDQKCVVITDRGGIVQAMTKSAEEIFQLEDCIFEYNKQFQKIYNVSKIIFFFNFF